MANEFKIKAGLLLGAPTTQPVTSIQDTSISITTDASSLLVTGKAIYDFHTANAGSSVSFGSQYQIPTVNSATNDFDYTVDFAFNGKSLKMADPSNNIIISDSLRTPHPSMTWNIIMGKLAGNSLSGESGYNTLIGSYVAPTLSLGKFNALFGNGAGTGLQHGNYNTIIGHEAAFQMLDASLNVIIGSQAGHSEMGSSKLYIDSKSDQSSDSSTSLIYGEFDGTRKFKVNAGTIEFNGLPSAQKSKALYFDTVTNRISYGDVSSGPTPTEYWTLDGSILSPTDDTVNVELSAIQIGTDAGTVVVMDMDVSSATTGTEESYSFNIDGSTVAKVYGKAVTGGALSEIGFVVETAQYMGNPNTNGSWRFYPDSNGDLVFEKRIAGTWTEKGKFTE